MGLRYVYGGCAPVARGTPLRLWWWCACSSWGSATFMVVVRLLPVGPRYVYGGGAPVARGAPLRLWWWCACSHSLRLLCLECSRINCQNKVQVEMVIEAELYRYRPSTPEQPQVSSPQTPHCLFGRNSGTCW